MFRNPTPESATRERGGTWPTIYKIARKEEKLFQSDANQLSEKSAARWPQLLIRVRQTREECRSPPKLLREGLDRPQSRRADVMFHAFHIAVDDVIVEAE
jgi:hypothetical protein